MTTTETRIEAFSMTHIRATVTPAYHVAHAGGEMSVRLTSGQGPLDVYVIGTRSEIAAWALAVRDEAIRGEEGD